MRKATNQAKRATVQLFPKGDPVIAEQFNLEALEEFGKLLQANHREISGYMIREIATALCNPVKVTVSRAMGAVPNDQEVLLCDALRATEALLDLAESAGSEHAEFDDAMYGYLIQILARTAVDRLDKFTEVYHQSERGTPATAH